MRILLLALVAACNSSAAAPNTGTGPVRDTGAFHGISVETIIEVEVTVGPATHVELRGPKQWTERITTTVDHDVLRIGLPSTDEHLPKLSAVITLPDLKSLAVSGVASIHATKISAKALEVAISGTGAIDLSGTADSMHVALSGTGQLAAKDLATQTTVLDVSGAGQATIRAAKRVDANVSGTADVEILGNPPMVNKHVSGVAQIH